MVISQITNNLDAVALYRRQVGLYSMRRDYAWSEIEGLFHVERRCNKYSILFALHYAIVVGNPARIIRYRKQ